METRKIIITKEQAGRLREPSLEGKEAICYMYPEGALSPLLTAEEEKNMAKHVYVDGVHIAGDFDISDSGES